jgi:hypothetical protein
VKELSGDSAIIIIIIIIIWHGAVTNRIFAATPHN